MSPLDRRAFIALTVATLVEGCEGPHDAAAISADPPAAPLALDDPPRDARFLTDHEFRTVEALAERIFPKSDDGPGASELGVATYIDRRLGGGWGRGARLYRSAPFARAAHAGHGYQSELAPAALYRYALAALDRHTMQASGAAFADLDDATKDRHIAELEAGSLATFVVASASEFWGVLRQNVLEGVFSDPQYGGNREMRGWAWIGFPGNPMAHGLDYGTYVDRYDAAYDAKPASLAQTAMSGMEMSK